jgi:hypothetical protein
MGAGYPSDVLLQAGAQADLQSPEHNHFKPQRYLPETPILPIKQIPSAERPRDEILLHASPKDFISHDNSIMKQLDTTQKEQESKHTNLVASHDTFVASEANPTLYNPKILASTGTGHPSDVLLQDQEPPGHDHSTSFNSRNPVTNPTLPTMQMTLLYGDAAGVTVRAGHPPAAEFLRLADPDLTKHDHQKIGRALRDVSNSKERAGHPDEILLQADDGGGADDDGNGGGGGDGDGGGDVLPFATDAPSVTMLPSITDASSLTNIWVANTIAVAGMRRRLTEVSKWEEMKTACGSSGSVVLSKGFGMGTYMPTPPLQHGGIDFSDKQLVVIGNNKALDARETG